MPSPEQRLIAAAIAGDEPEVRQLLSDAADPNASVTSDDGSPGVTALVGALLQNAGDSVIDMLLQAKGDVSKWPAGEALVVVSYAISQSQPRLLERLLALGFSPNTSMSDDGNRPLHLAISRGELECAQLLLDAGANSNQKMGGYPPIQLVMALGPDA